MREISTSARLSRVFAALSDPLRRALFTTLYAKPKMTVSDLCTQFPVSRFVVMRHLNVLEDAGLLHRERDGKAKYLSVPAGEPSDLLRRWLSDLENPTKETKPPI